MDFAGCDTYRVEIWVGLREGYTDWVHTIDGLRKICDDYVNEVGDCVSIIQSEFRYVGGSELGAVVGFINYPRFPRSKKEIDKRAMLLARKLKEGLGQLRISVVTPRETIIV